MEFATLEKLLETPGLKLKLLSQDVDLGVSVRWVAFTELLDPTPYLSGGEFVLTSGKAIPVDDGLAVEDYVRRLVGVGAVALGFGVDRIFSQVPDSVLSAAAASGLPVVEVSRTTSFASIGRAVTEMVAAAERRAAEAPYHAQRRLIACARRGHGIFSVVDEVALILHSPSALVSSAGLTMHTSQDGADEMLSIASEQVAHIRAKGLAASANFQVDHRHVAIHPIGVHGAPQMYLVTSWDTAARTLARTAVPTALTLVTLLAEQENVARSIVVKIHDQVARLVIRDEAPAASAVAAAADLLTSNSIDRSTVSVVAARSVAADRSLLDKIDQTSCYATTVGDETIVIVPASASPSKIVASIAETGAALGVSRNLPFAKAAIAVDQARRAIGSAGSTRTYDQLMRKDISAVVDDVLLEEWAGEVLEPLRSAGPEMRETLKVYLANHGQAQPTATQLGAHRHTVKARISRIEALLGLDLDSAEDRSNIVIALRHSTHL